MGLSLERRVKLYAFDCVEDEDATPMLGQYAWDGFELSYLIIVGFYASEHNSDDILGVILHNQRNNCVIQLDYDTFYTHFLYDLLSHTWLRKGH